MVETQDVTQDVTHDVGSGTIAVNKRGKWDFWVTNYPHNHFCWPLSSEMSTNSFKTLCHPPTSGSECISNMNSSRVCFTMGSAHLPQVIQIIELMIFPCIGDPVAAFCA